MIPVLRPPPMSGGGLLETKTKGQEMSTYHYEDGGHAIDCDGCGDMVASYDADGDCVESHEHVDCDDGVFCDACARLREHDSNCSKIDDAVSAIKSLLTDRGFAVSVRVAESTSSTYLSATSDDRSLTIRVSDHQSRSTCSADVYVRVDRGDGVDVVAAAI